MDPTILTVSAFIQMGNALWGSSWVQAIVKLIQNKEFQFNLTDEQARAVLQNLREKQIWLDEDSKPFTN